MEINSLSEVLFVHELGDKRGQRLEQQLLVALPAMASAARSYELRELFESHLDETRTHVERLEQAFAEMGVRFAPSKTYKAIEALLQKSDDIVNATGDSVAIDAALVGVAERIERYEIGAYSTARARADELGLNTTRSPSTRHLARKTKQTSFLTKLATGGLQVHGINRLAAGIRKAASRVSKSPCMKAWRPLASHVGIARDAGSNGGCVKTAGAARDHCDRSPLLSVCVQFCQPAPLGP